jgi:hypothetical protein
MEMEGHSNRPDETIKDKKYKICLSTDAEISSDRNTTKKDAEKKLQYGNLSIEIQRMWNIKLFLMPIVIGAMQWKKYLELIPGKHTMDSL